MGGNNINSSGDTNRMVLTGRDDDLMGKTGLLARMYRGAKMSYSVRYLDIKNRPMLQMDRGMDRMDVLVKLAKAAFWAAATFVIIGAWIYFLQNVTYWATK